MISDSKMEYMWLWDFCLYYQYINLILSLRHKLKNKWLNQDARYWIPTSGAPRSLMENWPSEDSLVREDCLLDKIRITQLTNDKNPGL